MLTVRSIIDTLGLYLLLASVHSYVGVILRWYADRDAGHFPFQIWEHGGNGLCGTGGSWNDVIENTASLVYVSGEGNDSSKAMSYSPRRRFFLL